MKITHLTVKLVDVALYAILRSRHFCWMLDANRRGDDGGGGCWESRMMVRVDALNAQSFFFSC
jgi:hypothetical protein